MKKRAMRTDIRMEKRLGKRKNWSGDLRIDSFFEGIRYSEGTDFAKTSGYLSDYGKRSHGLCRKILVNERKTGIKGNHEKMQLPGL